MTLMLSEADYHELCQQMDEPAHSHRLSDNEADTYCWLPTALGNGYTRCCELSSGIWLDLIDKEFTQPWELKVPVHEHLVQFTIMLSGVVGYDDTYPTLGDGQGYLSGSGLSPGYVAKYGQGPKGRSHQLKGISIHLHPEVIELFLDDQSPSLQQALVKPDDWKTAWFPKVTPAMRAVAQQMMQCPFQAVTRRLYLQAKVFELLALHLDAILADQGETPSPLTLKPSTVESIYQAREILKSQLENPPLLTELAQQVGVCDRTLRRGFRDLFGTTVVGYLTQQRLIKAEQLLRQGDCTVAEVANRVGYSHLGHFAAAFRKQIGVSPRECLR